MARAAFLFLPHFDVICDLLLKCMARGLYLLHSVPHQKDMFLQAT